MKQCKLIVNADDFGLDEAVNYGIIKAYTDGIITSTSIMANMPGFDHAVKLLKEYPGLHIGVHLNINAYKPLTNGRTLVNEYGMFDRREFKDCDEDEIYEEFNAQIKKVINARIEFDHFDSHRHVHQHPALENVMRRLLKEYPYPIRVSFSYAFDYPMQVTMNDDFYGEDVSTKKLITILKSLKAKGVYDLVTHPAYIDNFLLESSSYTLARAKELDVLCSEDVKSAIKELGIELTTYSCLKDGSCDY